MSSYSNYGPEWTKSILKELEKAGSWEVGITSDKKHRGAAINVDVVSLDVERNLAVVQVRHTEFNPRWSFSKTHKDYYLIGRNENGVAFAHSVDTPMRWKDCETRGVIRTVAVIWNCAEEDVDDIQRNGDVAFVPVGNLPTAATLIEGAQAVTVRKSHQVVAGKKGALYSTPDGTIYVSREARIKHTKGQHPTAKIRGGYWRVQEGVRASHWGFTRPTFD